MIDLRWRKVTEELPQDASWMDMLSEGKYIGRGFYDGHRWCRINQFSTQPIEKWRPVFLTTEVDDLLAWHDPDKEMPEPHVMVEVIRAGGDDNNRDFALWDYGYEDEDPELYGPCTRWEDRNGESMIISAWREVIP